VNVVIKHCQNFRRGVEMPPKNFNRHPNIFRNINNRQQYMPRNNQQQHMQNMRRNSHGQQQNMPRSNNQRQAPQSGRRTMPNLNNLPTFEPLKGETPLTNWTPKELEQNNQPSNNWPSLPKSNGIASYEQIDEKTMEEIRKVMGGNAETNTEINTVENNVTSEDFSKFIQNERNASLYYKHLASVSKTAEHKKVLESISQESTARSEELSQIYQNMYGNSYEIKDVRINDTVGFEDGLSLAIDTESKIIKELLEHYNTANEVQSKKIILMINKKFCDIISLKMLYIKSLQ